MKASLRLIINMSGNVAPAIILTIVMVGMQGGCAWRDAASPQRTLLSAMDIASIHWPQRWTSDLDDVARRVPGQISVEYPSFEIDKSGHLVQGTSRTPICNVLKRHAEAMGVLLEYESILPKGLKAWSDPHHSTITSLRFYSWLSTPPSDQSVFEKSLSTLAVGTVGTVFIPEGREPVGLAVFLGGGSEYDWPLRWDMLEHGWVILQSGTDGRAVDLQWEPHFTVDADHPAKDVAVHIAQAVDEQIAEDVYAGQAFINFTHHICPALAGKPTVLIGLSRGSFSIPALAARLGGKVGAAVIVGGGADLPVIAMDTAEYQGSLVITGSPGIGVNDDERDAPVSASDRKELNDAFLAATQLGPYVTSPALNCVPVLMLEGMFDAIVPAPTGKMLYERLGKPERWSYPLGHGGVFWSLNNDRAKVSRWIDEQTGVTR